MPPPVLPALRIAPLLFMIFACGLGACAEPVQPTGGPFHGALRGDVIEVLSERPDLNIKFLIIESTGVAVDYGVYALWGAKSEMRIPRPSVEEGGRWDGRDARAALLSLLAGAGFSGPDALRSVETHGVEVFGAGLRALLVLPIEVQSELGLAADLLVFEFQGEGPGAPRWLRLD